MKRIVHWLLNPSNPFGVPIILTATVVVVNLIFLFAQYL